MSLTFTKMHGLGNDFVVFNSLSSPLNFNLNPTTLQKLADRHLGIGCDQLLVLEPSKTQEADFYCRIFNADGSEAGMSGNGLRCLAKYVYSRKLTNKRSFVIATNSRNVAIVIEDDGQITLNLGFVDFEPKNIPILATQKALSYNLQTSVGTFAIGAVSVGNPHAVIQVDDINTIDVSKIGAAISQHMLFPKQANVNFMQIIDRSNIKLRTYERGTGETLACGSGSSAAVAIGIIWQLLDKLVTVHWRHGNLQVKWENVTSPLFLTGEAVAVFDGISQLDFAPQA